MLGTAISALVLGYAGRAYDRFGARVVGTAAALGLGMSLMGLTQVTAVVESTGGLIPAVTEGLVALVVLSMGFFCIRFFGQGVLTMVSRNMVMTWFNDRRGPASATIGVSVALAFAGGPSLFNIMIGAFGWRGAWGVLGIALIIFAGVVAAVFRDGRRDRRASESVGEEDSGAEAAAEEMGRVMRLLPPRLRFLARRERLHPDQDFSLREAKKTLLFWVYCGSLGISSLVGTGFAFHVVDLMGEVGLSRPAALAVFVPSSLISVAIQMAANIVSDYIRLKYLVVLEMRGVIMIAFAIAIEAPLVAYWLAATGLALATGMSGVVSVIAWPRYFGLTSLGAISGFGFSWIVGGSALGPYAFSLVQSLTGTYRVAAFVFIVVSAAVGLAAFYTVHPRKPNGV